MTITFIDLVHTIPELINLFLSGFIFIVTYNWLNHRDTDISIIAIISLFISILVKSICCSIHLFIFQNIIFSDSSKILIYALIGLVLAFCITVLKRTKFISRILYIANNKSANEDIFDDVIDYSKKTMMMVYLKSSDIYYIGRFLYREEKGLDSWIALVDYYSIDKTNEPVFDPDKNDLYSTALVNLNDVERIQIIYEKDSDVWKRFSSNIRP